MERARCALTPYFEHIRDANLAQWESGRAGVLCTNVAVQAYISLLASLIKYWEANTASDAKEIEAEELIAELEEYLQPVLDFLKKSDDELRSAFNVPFGSGGPPEYYFRLCGIIKSQFADFEPEGMEDWIASRSEENVEAADKKIKEVYSSTQHHLFHVLKLLYGESDYLKKGVPDKKMKTEAFAKHLEEEERGQPLETYFDFIDLKKIIENKQNWPHLKDIFNIPEPGEKGLAKNLKWMDRINELRRISAHPARERSYKVDDFEYIDYVHETLMENIRQWEWLPPQNSDADGE